MSESLSSVLTRNYGKMEVNYWRVMARMDCHCQDMADGLEEDALDRRQKCYNMC